MDCGGFDVEDAAADPVLVAVHYLDVLALLREGGPEVGNFAGIASEDEFARLVIFVAAYFLDEGDVVLDR